MSSDSRSPDIKTASLRLGAALDRLESALDACPPASSEIMVELSEVRAEAMAMADDASAAIGEAVGDLRVALMEALAENDGSGNGG